MSHMTSYLAGAAATLLAMTAHAATTPSQDRLQPPSRAVRYGDLDLSTTEGSARLYRRLTHAAQQVCPQVQPKDLGDYIRSRDCQVEAIRRAVRDIDSPMLARVANAHGVSND
jgi:UrcA family protein